MRSVFRVFGLQTANFLPSGANFAPPGEGRGRRPPSQANDHRGPPPARPSHYRDISRYSGDMHNHEHPPWAAPPPFGGRRGRRRNMGFGPPGAFFGPGPRARGDVRAAILALLAEAPMHVYQIITEITDRSQGVWSPSPGSVYPTLQALEEEGLVTSATADGKKVFSLTEA